MNAGSSLVKRETREGWNETQGDYVEYMYEGSESSVRGAEYSERQAGAIETQITDAADVGTWRLRVRYNSNPSDPGAEYPTVEFRMDPGRVNQSPLQPPYNAINSISSANLAEIRRALDENDTALSLDGGPSESLAQDLYLIMLRGEGYRTIYRPTFTLVRTAGSSYIWPDQGGSVGSVFLRDSVLSEVQGISGSVPNFALQQGTWDNTGAEASWHYGWLKHAPNYDTVIGNRTSENIDWEYGLWPEALYGVPS